MAPVLEIENLHTHIKLRQGTVRPVDGVNLHVEPGETLGIVGESGCGKTMTALSIMGLLPVGGSIAEGRIFLDGQQISGLSDERMRRIRGNDVGMIFQDPLTSLNPTMTVGKQIAEAVLLHREVSKGQAMERAAEVLDLVGMPTPKERLNEYPHQFSGGMRQRVMIAMALACEPKLLIADEPTTALDVTIQAQILNLLRELVADRDTALVLITHDLGVVAGMCERVHVMYAGMFMGTGSAEQVFETPRHPYTLGLLQSVPRLDAPRGRKLHPIEGAPRDMLNAPAYCPFAPRCSYEVTQSRLEVPPLLEMEPGHHVACFNPVPADAWAREAAPA